MRTLALSALLGLAACGDAPPERTLVLYGVTIATAVPFPVAVVAEANDAAGNRLLGYGMLGLTEGQQTVGEAAAPGTKVLLSVGIDADVCHAGAGIVLQPKNVAALAGANAGNGRLELRGARATLETAVDAGTSLRIAWHGGAIRVTPQ